MYKHSKGEYYHNNDNDDMASIKITYNVALHHPQYLGLLTHAADVSRPHNSDLLLPTILLYALSNCQPSVTEPFQLSPPISGMHCFTMSLHHHPSTRSDIRLFSVIFLLLAVQSTLKQSLLLIPLTQSTNDAQENTYLVLL